MRWSNVKLIFHREVRDQLRDRRTLFTIAVLPLLLYPLLGMTFLQVSQFTHEQPAVVGVWGAEQLPADPPLLDQQQFHADCCPAEEARLLQLEVLADSALPSGSGSLAARAAAAIQDGKCAAVVVFPPGFAESLAQFRAAAGGDVSADGGRVPQPQIVFDAASDRSRIASVRLRRVLESWRRAIVRQYLVERQISPHVTAPFDIGDVDVSKELSRRAAFWSKVLPFVVFVWALTGAFYPAVDLCAGEKERGTLETLLSSPAERCEIVLGKLLTIMGFSAATSLLNLLSMAVTGTTVILLQPAMFPIGPPPIASLGWLLLALVPVSALFSALALAIAAFARSTKEGQYYLMPLLLICLPLMILPLLPAVTLNLGTSLIPVSGIMLLLRGLVEGQYAEAALYAPPVLMVTGTCCLLATRWAIDQFNNESVLFRESERIDFWLWLRHLVRDRERTPTFGQALACGLILLTIRFFGSFAAPMPETWRAFAFLQLMTQVGLLALPVVVLTALLTRSARDTLLLRPVGISQLVVAMLLAIMLHPTAMWIAGGIQRLYPMNERMLAQMQDLQQIVGSAPSFWHIVVLMALVPALCEELVFRGFILSGLRRWGSTGGAIVLSSVLFGVTHGVLQQSINATLVGLVIGWIAVRTGSLWPGVVFHLVYNTMSLVPLAGIPVAGGGTHWWNWWVDMDGGAIAYRWPAIVIGLLISVWILAWWSRSAQAFSAPEPLVEAVSSSSANATVGSS